MCVCVCVCVCVYVDGRSCLQVAAPRAYRWIAVSCPIGFQYGVGVSALPILQERLHEVVWTHGILCRLMQVTQNERVHQFC